MINKECEMYFDFEKKNESKLVLKRAGNQPGSGEERLLFWASKGTQLNDYAFYDCTYDGDGNPTNVYRHFFRFPKHEMKEDGYICVYTRPGTGFATMNGSRILTYRMGLDKDILNDGGDCVYVIKIRSTVAYELDGE